MCLHPYDVASRHCVLIPVSARGCLDRWTCVQWDLLNLGAQCIRNPIPYPRPARRQAAVWISYFNCSVARYTSGTDNYIQLVWSNTHKIGCGFTAFSSSDGMYNKFYVCIYGPGGNIIGGSRFMYLPGTAGMQCSAGSTGNDKGLCLCP